MILNRDEIKLLIPHRSPFLFLDKCNITEIGVSGVGLRKFNKNEYFFKGHFPSKPIVPGVILIEALAQTAGVVVSKSFENFPNKSVLFMSVSKAKFRKPVYPDDNIKFSVHILNNVKSVYKFSGIAYKEELKVCESEFSAMITHS
jgi:3-hydroxyacyl-[acyl-carrier-protein] dehydratase